MNPAKAVNDSKTKVGAADNMNSMTDGDMSNEILMMSNMEPGGGGGSGGSEGFEAAPEGKGE